MSDDPDPQDGEVGTPETDDVNPGEALTDGLSELVALERAVDAAAPALETVHDDVEALERAADEAADLLSTVDVPGLVDAIDATELPNAVDSGEPLEAVRSGSATDAVDIRDLLVAADTEALWESVDAREFWRESRQLSDALDALEWPGSDTEDDHPGREPSSVMGAGRGPAATDSDSRLAGSGVDTQALERRAQTAVNEAVVGFRESILAARRELRTVRERNRDRVQPVGDTDSRNPTAVSTMTRTGARGGLGSRHSSIPAETRHSTAPNHPRLYGDRFDESEVDDE